MPTVINYMADVPASFSALAEMPDWVELAQGPWSDLADIVAVDTYPNFLSAAPAYGSLVGERVARAVAASGSPPKPVWVAETGVGVIHAAQAAGVPQVPATNFSETAQAAYFTGAYTSAAAAGASGFFVFGLWADPGITPPAGGYTMQDQAALSAASALYINGTDAIPAFIEFVLGNLDYTLTRLPELAVNVSNHFGVFGDLPTNGSLPVALPAAHTIASLFASAKL